MISVNAVFVLLAMFLLYFGWNTRPETPAKNKLRKVLLILGWTSAGIGLVVVDIVETLLK